MSDFITDYMQMTEGTLSPEIFRKWAAISALGASLERRVWLPAGERRVYANLYVMLVAPPGVGKYVIESTRQILEGIKDPARPSQCVFGIAPDSVTKASLVDAIGETKRQILPKDGPPILYQSLYVASEEFGVVMPGYDMEFIATLNRLYNNVDIHRETRRTGSVKELILACPQLNILAGAQPGWLSSVFPEEAWSTGLASRLTLVYAAEVPIKDPFWIPPKHADLKERVRGRLAKVAQIYGEIPWEKDAQEALSHWWMNGAEPRPTHSKLAYYCNRRSLQLMKLILIATVAREAQCVTLADYNTALGWMLEVEVLMPDIFRAMIGKSDMQVMEELHHYITGIWNMNKQKPVHERALFSFLAQRVPSERVQRLLEVAERSNIIARVGGSECLYIPKPKHEHGVE